MGSLVIAKPSNTRWGPQDRFSICTCGAAIQYYPTMEEPEGWMHVTPKGFVAFHGRAKPVKEGLA